MSTHDLARLISLAAGQQGLFTRPQALRAGVTDRRLERLRAAGVVVSLGSGVLRVPGREGWLQDQWAAHLAAGAGVRGSHRAAARLLELEGFDAAVLSEVIEHLDPERLGALERVVFEFARPRVVVITTPNREYNSKFEGMAPGQLRHDDHRFEWTRAEFAAWAEPVAERYGYTVRTEGLGETDPELGAPSQMAVFER